MSEEVVTFCGSQVSQIGGRGVLMFSPCHSMGAFVLRSHFALFTSLLKAFRFTKGTLDVCCFSVFYFKPNLS